MKKNISFLKTLFFPLACLVALCIAAALFSNNLGTVIESSILKEKGANSLINLFLETQKPLFGIGKFLLFVIGILFLRKINFNKIFRFCLVFLGAVLILSISLFRSSKIGYCMTTQFCPPILLFLGWAYVNQITQRLEGMKYYFALNGVASLIALPSYFVFQALIAMTGSLSSTSPILLAPALACLGIIWLCDHWIQNQSKDRVQIEETPLPSPNPWSSAFLLGFIFVSLTLMNILNAPAFQSHIKTSTTSISEYPAVMLNHGIVVRIGIIMLTILSLFVGPKLLDRKGWKFSILIAPILGACALIAFLCMPPQWGYTFYETALKSVKEAWVFPLIQIAILCSPQKDRFFTQALTFLVFSPLISWGAGWITMGTLGVSVLSFVILGLMAVCSTLMGKNNPLLSHQNNETTPA